MSESKDDLLNSETHHTVPAQKLQHASTSINKINTSHTHTEYMYENNTTC